MITFEAGRGLQIRIVFAMTTVRCVETWPRILKVENRGMNKKSLRAEASPGRTR